LALRTTGADRGSIAAYGAPHIYLGGLNVDTRANRSRELTVSTRTGLVVVDPRTGTSRAVQTPAGATISAETWSPRGDKIAFIANFPTASHAYVADVTTGRSTQITRTPLLATLVDEVRFTADGSALVVVLLPADRGPMPTHGADGIEDGPRVRITGSRKVPQPVHWSLLEDPHDQAQLEWVTTGQLALVEIASRRERLIGRPTMVRAVDLSPDGTHLRVTRMTKPFSYLVPVSSFGSVQELWDLTGRSSRRCRRRHSGRRRGAGLTRRPPPTRGSGTCSGIPRVADSSTCDRSSPTRPVRRGPRRAADVVDPATAPRVRPRAAPDAHSQPPCV